MQTLIRSIIGGLALGALAMAAGFAVLGLSFGLGLPADPWLVALGAAGATAALGMVTFLSLGRAVRRLQTGLQQPGPSAAIVGPRWMRPILKALTQQQLSHQQAEVAWRTRQRDLEIRAHVAESARLQSHAVLEVMDDAVLVCTPILEIVSMNAAAARLLEVSADEVVGCPMSEVVTDATLRRFIQSTLESGVATECRRGEVTLGGSNACEMVASCATDHRGRVSAVVTVLHDLTREREISQMKSEFVSKASHELRTPLSSMRAYVEMLVDGEASDEATRQEFYAIIQSETDRLSRLVDNMLNISRIEAGIIELDRTAVDMPTLIERAVQTLEPQAREKQIDLHTEIAPVGTTVHGDADMLQQVVINLLSNAVKYTPEGGRVTVHVDSDTLSRSVHVSVSDTGLGIAPHDAEQVFEKFYRVENYKRVAKGTGLGLNLCRHIVETVHQGQIGLESTLGMGSRFWFSVPMSQQPARVAA